MLEEWLTTQEAAELSGYHVDYVRKLVQANKVQGRKFGPLWQVNRTSLLSYLSKMGDLGARRGPKTN